MSEIKWPTGEWSHTELADFNGKTKPSVYNQLQDALKNGTVVKTNKRQGQGKPTQLYTVAALYHSTSHAGAQTIVAQGIIPAPVVKETIPPITEVVSATINVPVTVEVPVEVTVETKMENQTVEVIDIKPIEPSLKVEEMPANTHSIDEVCPVCKHKLFAWNDNTGVMVQCLQPIAVCKSAEHPFGHGRNEKSAYETLVEKWTFCMKGDKA